ncbi:Tungstate uptake system permease protein TupB [Moorella thermoacetica]|uniref:Sulfate transport system permease protein CysW n=2 Tax=Neomoorella thermoacetica TaxID=1525 RepID=A0AAC9HFB2_NEOTH|nr:ABC transporter permease [Moorella thermoacetica]AOQ22567.1 Sulfate transport system permease protein CysW [Moorella thermoacetica]TYL13188.1 Tungstate uptake system permease protein TupB [Moorella thermoacetica]GAF25833.1 ABC-type tungstate transport system, periplasmic component [Moorella thermoacetica Y72]
MEAIWQGLVQAFLLIIKLNPGVMEVVTLTLKVCGLATAISILIGVPLGIFLALKAFPGRQVVVSLVNTGMGMPPVVVGLVVSFLLWRSGPLGYFGLIYTPAAMVIAQALIAAPLITGLTMAAIQQLPRGLKIQVLALGATPGQLYWTLLKEARLGILAAVIAGFGGVISEVGAATMVGGNIMHQTRVLTTATVMEVSRGHFDVAMALSFILLGLSFAVTFALTVLQQRERTGKANKRRFLRFFRS